MNQGNDPGMAGKVTRAPYFRCLNAWRSEGLEALLRAPWCALRGSGGRSVLAYGRSGKGKGQWGGRKLRGTRKDTYKEWNMQPRGTQKTKGERKERRGKMDVRIRKERRRNGWGGRGEGGAKGQEKGI